MEDKPRYSRVSDILDLAIFMQSKVLGVTISDIMERYNVSRRTAERMRDSLTNIFPQVDEIETDDTQKHWGFTNFSMHNLITFTPKELANIEQLQRRTTNKEMKEELGKTVGTDTNKNTFVRLYGLEKCEQLVQQYTQTALDALSAFEDADFLRELAVQLTSRIK